MKGQKVGSGAPSPKQRGEPPHSLAYEVAQLVESSHPAPRVRPPCQRDHTLWPEHLPRGPACPLLRPALELFPAGSQGSSWQPVPGLSQGLRWGPPLRPRRPATSSQRKREKTAFPFSLFPFHYKSKAHSFLQTEPPHLPLPLPVSCINTAASHVSLCLSLNSFWAET